MRSSVAAVLALLVASCSRGASKRSAEPQSADDAAVDAASDSASTTAAAPPAADGWEEIKVGKAKLRVRIPKGASIPEDRAGRDPTFAGSYFRVVMPSGYDVYFAQRHGTIAVDLAIEKQAYRSKPRERVSFLFEADDAVIVHRNDPPPSGSYCEVTACGRLGERPMCVSNEGARIDGTEVKKLTEAECFAVVSIARSIREL